jgi:hypothetical protein
MAPPCHGTSQQETGWDPPTTIIPMMMKMIAIMIVRAAAKDGGVAAVVVGATMMGASMMGATQGTTGAATCVTTGGSSSATSSAPAALPITVVMARTWCLRARDGVPRARRAPRAASTMTSFLSRSGHRQHQRWCMQQPPSYYEAWTSAAGANRALPQATWPWT